MPVIFPVLTQVAKALRYSVGPQEFLQVRGPAADPDDRIRIRRAPDVLPAPNHLTVVARRVRLDADRRAYPGPWHGDSLGRWQTLRPGLRRPHPGALVGVSKSRTTVAPDHNRAVDVRRPTLVRQSHRRRGSVPGGRSTSAHPAGRRWPPPDTQRRHCRRRTHLKPNWLFPAQSCRDPPCRSMRSSGMHGSGCSHPGRDQRRPVRPGSRRTRRSNSSRTGPRSG